VPQHSDRDAARILGAYQATLAAGLAGSRQARAGILAEIADGLLEATQAHQDNGLPAQAAAEAAVAEFGEPRGLARLLVAEQAGAAAHRVGLGLVLTGPLVGTAWLLAWTARSGLGWADQIGGLLSQYPLLVVVLGLGVPAAVLAATAGAGPMMRRLALAPRHAAALAMLAAGAALLGDTTLLTGVAVTHPPAAGWSWPLMLAVTVSGIRFTAAATAVNRCARLRAAS
jgi:hypothetical protein